jgi:cob(I)alamin adenosyltransferase
MGGLKNGLVHVYTGPGKGKTTAAMGLAIRAAGCGLNVSIYQFMKATHCGEARAFKKIKNIKFRHCGSGCFIKGRPMKRDIDYAVAGFAKTRADIMTGKYDLVILDEVNVATRMGLIKVSEVLDAINRKPASVEVILTGRDADRRVIERADYVTRFVKVKHPYDKGLQARRGVEY